MNQARPRLVLPILAVFFHCQYGVAVYKFEFSESLSDLFDIRLSGCTIRVMLPKFAANSMYEQLVTKDINGKIEPRPYFVDELFSHKAALQLDLKYTDILKHWVHTKPRWTLKKHNLCYAHMYMVYTIQQYKTSLNYHYVDFDLRKDRPQFIIIWDFCEERLDLREYFQWKESFLIFSDFRMYVRMKETSAAFELSLICVICWYTTDTKAILQPLLKSDVGFIHRLWKTMHTNHGQRRGLSCYGCIGLPSYMNEGKKPLYDIVGHYFNMTIQPFHYEFDSNTGYMSNNIINFIPDSYFNIEHNFLRPRSPSFAIIPSFMKTYEYKLVTVVRKSLMTRIGWTAMFVPFENSLWLSWMALAIFITGVLRHISEKTTKPGSLHMIVFTVVRPVTEQGFTKIINGPTGHILSFWFLLCFYLHMFYGGDLAASISTLLVPPYPQNIYDLGRVGSKLRTLTPYLTSGGGEWTKRLLGWTQRDSVRSSKIIEELTRTRCPENQCDFNLTNANAPLKCKHDLHDDAPFYAYDMPITFIENEYRASSIRIAYQSSPLFWVSPTTVLPNGQQLFPMITIANYFGKLVHPLFSAWFAFGLENHWFKLRQYGKQKSKGFFYQRIPRSELKSLASSTYYPMQLDSLTSVAAIMYVLVSVAVLVLLVELTMYHLDTFLLALKVMLNSRNLKNNSLQILFVKYSGPYNERSRPSSSSSSHGPTF